MHWISKETSRVPAEFGRILLIRRPQAQMVVNALLKLRCAICYRLSVAARTQSHDQRRRQDRVHEHNKQQEPERIACYKKSDTTMSGISECRQRHSLTCQFPELSGHILTESQTAQLSIPFSALHVSSTEFLACRLIGTCARRLQNY